MTENLLSHKNRHIDRSIWDLLKRAPAKAAMQEKSKGDSSLPSPSHEPGAGSHHHSHLDTPTNLRRSTSLASQESLKPGKQVGELKKCLGDDTTETIMKSYSCAWQRDILVHGRLYITQKYLCFYSNILGWETKTTIPLSEVTAITKQKTAKLFPNAILIETGDRKFGFSSFYHRDKAFLVLLTVWDNSLLEQPLAADSLREKVKSLKVSKDQEEVLLSGTRSKSGSFLSEGSDMDPSHVLTGSDSPVLHHHHHHQHTTSTSSSTGTAGGLTNETEATEELERDEFDGRLSASSSDSLTTSTSTPHTSISSTAAKEHSSTTTDESSSSSSELEWTSRQPRTQPAPPSSQDHHHRGVVKSPSLLTLKSDSSPCSSPTTMTEGRGGSPNWIHHWKQNLTTKSSYQRIHKLLSPQVLIRACSSAVLINILILIFIALLLLMSLSMVCYISRVEPALQPYLKWQPWCSYCSYDQGTQEDSELALLARALLSGMDTNTDIDSSSVHPP